MIAAPTVGIYAIAREVLALLEPDSTLRDDAFASPLDPIAGRMYCWPRVEGFTVADMKPTWREDFNLRVAKAAAADHEVGARDPAVTLFIEAWADEVIRLVRTPLSGTTFDALWVTAADYETLVTPRARGFILDLTGYRYRSD